MVDHPVAVPPMDDPQARHAEEQFGTLGCVGRGRCIAWFPVGIDITGEATAIRATHGLTRLPAGATP